MSNQVTFFDDTIIRNIIYLNDTEISDSFKELLEKTELEANMSITDKRTRSCSDPIGLIFPVIEKICHICGVEKEKHKSLSHKFIEATYSNKCIKCKKWFYQHNHLKNPCFKLKN